jgi:hypothetical protein
VLNIPEGWCCTVEKNSKKKALSDQHSVMKEEEEEEGEEADALSTGGGTTMASKRDTEEDAANVTEEEEEDESGPANSCRVARTVRRGRAAAPAFAGVLVIAPNRRGCTKQNNPHSITEQFVRSTDIGGGAGSTRGLAAAASGDMGAVRVMAKPEVRSRGSVWGS